MRHEALRNGFGTARRHIARNDSRAASAVSPRAEQTCINYALVLDPFQTLSSVSVRVMSNLNNSANDPGKSLYRAFKHTPGAELCSNTSTFG